MFFSGCTEHIGNNVFLNKSSVEEHLPQSRLITWLVKHVKNVALLKRYWGKRFSTGYSISYTMLVQLAITLSGPVSWVIGCTPMLTL